MGWHEDLTDAERAEFRKWADHQESVVRPAMEGSAYVMSIAPRKPDAKFCVELGMALMLGKPLILIVTPGAVVPDRLRAVADAVIETDMADEKGTQAKIGAALARLKEAGLPEGQ